MGLSIKISALVLDCSSIFCIITIIIYEDSALGLRLGNMIVVTGFLLITDPTGFRWVRNQNDIWITLNVYMEYFHYSKSIDEIFELNYIWIRKFDRSNGFLLNWKYITLIYTKSKLLHLKKRKKKRRLSRICYSIWFSQI